MTPDIRYGPKNFGIKSPDIRYAPNIRYLRYKIRFFRIFRSILYRDSTVPLFFINVYFSQKNFLIVLTFSTSESSPITESSASTRNNTHSDSSKHTTLKSSTHSDVSSSQKSTTIGKRYSLYVYLKNQLI